MILSALHVENCGITQSFPCGVETSQVHKTRAFVPWQGENRGVHIGMDALLSELLVKALHGSLWRVVVFAEVTQHNMLYFRTIHLHNETSRLLVAEVSERPCNALFQRKWITAFFEHFGVVVRLNDDVLSPPNLFLHHLVKHTDVGGNRQRMSFIIKMITHRPPSIVHDRESLNRDAEQRKGLHWLNFMEKRWIGVFGGPAFQKPLKAVGMGVNRYGTAFCQVFQAQHMVDMVMRDEDGLNVLQRDVVFEQILLDLSRRDAHIHQDTFVLTANVIAVAATPRSEAAKHERRKAGKEVHWDEFGRKSRKKELGNARDFGKKVGIIAPNGIIKWLRGRPHGPAAHQSFIILTVSPLLRSLCCPKSRHRAGLRNGNGRGRWR